MSERVNERVIRTCSSVRFILLSEYVLISLSGLKVPLENIKFFSSHFAAHGRVRVPH